MDEWEYLRRLLIMRLVIAILLVQLALCAYDWSNVEHAI